MDACRTKCVDSASTFTRYKCKKGSSKTAKGANNIKDMLFKYGSIFVTFDVYEDFFNYARGYYRYTTGAFVGYHAVKLIGWGYDWFRDVDYFIV